VLDERLVLVLGGSSTGRMVESFMVTGGSCSGMKHGFFARNVSI
jgi:hypothetical protein